MSTYVKIETISVGSGGASSIDFTAIPQTYTDLALKLSSRAATGGAVDVLIQFNTDATSGNYSQRQLQGSGSGTPSSGAGNQQSATSDGSTDTASTFANSEIYITNYSGSTYKNFSTDTVTENNSTTAYSTLRAGLWNSTTAINAIKLTHNGGASFAQYSTATLYGIKKN
jgi:hypothetical protein